MVSDVKGRIHSIESFGALDGPGIRFVLFMQGCPLKCLYCHNPDSWDTEIGRVVTAGEIMKEILTYENFIRSGGVTLSGGEPLYQPEFTEALLTLCKQHGLHTAVDTSGAVSLLMAKKAIDLADLLLLDVKALDPVLCKQLTGKTNENALQILEYRERIGKPVWIRHVMVPGYTLDPQKLEQLAVYLAQFTCIEKVELLPFHKMGEFKWEELGREYQLGDTPAPTPTQVKQAKDIFRKHGFSMPE